jgi:hypothetical protein
LRRLESEGELEASLDVGVKVRGFHVKINKTGCELFRTGGEEGLKLLDGLVDKLEERMKKQEILFCARERLKQFGMLYEKYTALPLGM